MKKILIIEDDEAVRENTAELLTINDFLVLTAENGQSGFEMAKAQQPDVVLCDMMMPKTDGRGFLRLVKEDAALKHVPVIFFSAGTLSLKEQNNLTKKGNGFLKKPFLEEDLLQIIRHTLDSNSNSRAVV